MSREFLEGNEVIAAAAIKAGCDFFAGYPITPASSILHYMLNLVPGVGGKAIQCEDEIASMGFCIAAAMTGKKVLTATSGPGMSLYSENIGLAQIGETPMVIINIQRQGPATGSATKGAEGDILFTRWITSGGMPIIALSPATVGEAYELTFRAFNLAEQYRTPVVLQASKEIGVTRESVDLDAIELPPVYPRKKSDSLQHHFDKPTDIPGMLEFDGKNVSRYTTSTHGKDAYLTSDPVLIQEMLDHYIEKITAARNDIALYKTDMQDGADTLLLGYGVTYRSIKVAVEQARANGKKVSSIQIQSLYPVPTEAILTAMKGVKKVVVPEMNMGQYIRDIERIAPKDVEVVGVNKMNTYLVSPTEILEKGGLS
ncbi:MAG: pyruvate flavodoxin/ferredoxin oxidoreductase [Deltaproteobacteria bacterium]|nr:pyruvate flavodoxin/ferredoxin oxidoreductase [Deltaproteobacteria bacterium]